MTTPLALLVSSLETMPAILHGSLALIPLRSSAQPGPSYLVLTEALAGGAFQITEMVEETVPLLLAINSGTSPVFLLDGEELIGAKQNRVLNLSLLIPPGSRTEIPVSCVEAGRWHNVSSDFATSDTAHFASGRSQRLQAVTRCLRDYNVPRSDQEQIWTTIRTRSARAGVASETEAMSDLFEKVRPTIEGFVSALIPPAEAVGGAFFIGDKFAGLDVFDQASTFGKLSRKLVSSYALDAIETDTAAIAPDELWVCGLLDMFRGIAPTEHPAAGGGKTLRLSGQSVTGAALVVDGTVIHAECLPTITGLHEDETPTILTSASRRARRLY